MAFFRTLSQFFKQLAGTSTFDPEACIESLLDKAQAEVNRVAAAESLGWGELGPSLSRAVDALYQVACDHEDLFIVREEAAQSLGFIWSETGVDRARFAALPEDMRFEVWASMPPDSGTAGP
jgi:hypothetical protein